jgi:predicted ferric reductase
MHKAIFALTLVIASIVGAFVYMPAHTAAEGNSSIVVQPIAGPTVAEKITDRAKTSWPWYVTRASGLVAAVSLVLLLISGIGQVTGYMFKFLEPLTAWASHRALGIVFGVSVLLHIIVLLFDHFAPFTLAQVLIPWLSDYKPVTLFGLHLGSLYVTLGVLAFYCVIAIMLTSYIWIEKKPTIWKLTHLLSYLVMILIFFHALMLGTDLAHGIFRWAWILSGYCIVALIVHRLYRARTT